MNLINKGLRESPYYISSNIVCVRSMEHILIRDK
jgi:hypothetical protein